MCLFYYMGIIKDCLFVFGCWNHLYKNNKIGRNGYYIFNDAVIYCNLRYSFIPEWHEAALADCPSLRQG